MMKAAGIREKGVIAVQEVAVPQAGRSDALEWYSSLDNDTTRWLKQYNEFKRVAENLQFA
jgi:hypothetical protein